GGGEHIGEVVAPLGAGAGDDLVDVRPGRQLGADDSGVDDVHGLAEDLGGDDGEDDGTDDEGDDVDQPPLFGGHEPEQAFDRRPEVLGLPRRCAPAHLDFFAAGDVV